MPVLVAHIRINGLSQYWFRLWLNAWWQQAITCTNVGLSSITNLTNAFFKNVFIPGIYLNVYKLSAYMELVEAAQIAKFMGPTWGPPGSCRPQMGPMLAPWTLLSGSVFPIHLCLVKMMTSHAWCRVRLVTKIILKIILMTIWDIIYRATIW